MEKYPVKGKGLKHTCTINLLSSGIGVVKSKQKAFENKHNEEQ